MKINISIKLWTLLSSALVALLVVGLISIYGVRSLNSEGKVLYDNVLKLEVTENLYLLFHKQILLVHDATTLTDLKVIEERRQAFETNNKQLPQIFSDQHFSQNFSEAEQKIQQAFKKFSEQSNKLF